MSLISNINRYIHHIHEIIQSNKSATPQQVLKQLLEFHYLHQYSTISQFFSHCHHYHTDFAKKIIKQSDNSNQLNELEIYFISLKIHNKKMNHQGDFYALFCAYFFYYEYYFAGELNNKNNIKNEILNCVEAYRRDWYDKKIQLYTEQATSKHISFAVHAYKTLGELNYIPEKMLPNVINVLLKGLTAANSDICSASCIALAKLIDHENVTEIMNKSIDKLLNKMLEINNNNSLTASQALVNMKHFPAEKLEKLIENLKENILKKDNPIAAASCQLLGQLQNLPEKFQQEVKVFLQTLIFFSHVSNKIKKAATHVLIKYFHPSDHLLNKWLGFLSSKNVTERRVGCELFAHLTQVPENIIPTFWKELLKNIKHQDAKIRIAALDTLAHFADKLSQKKADQIVKKLLIHPDLNSISKQNQAVRAHLCLALSRFKTISDEVRNDIVKHLTFRMDVDEDIFTEACQALGEMQKISADSLLNSAIKMIYRLEKLSTDSHEIVFHSLQKLFKQLPADRLINLQIRAENLFSEAKNQAFSLIFSSAIQSEMMSRVQQIEAKPMQLLSPSKVA
ncbi:MAG: hypothetical protein ACD_46C00242G0001 [uncultured bacterium]|nr:MAG: hypothetical protein ACD_46C00242G0001 [uncultured bacterium]